MNELKEMLGYITLNTIPREFRRGTIWFKENRFGLLTNDNIILKTSAKNNIYTQKTFFLKPRLTPCEEKEIKENMKDYILFCKLDKKTLKAKDIMSCTNMEIRRFLLRRFGYEKFVEELKGNIIHRDGTSELININWHKEEEPIKLVKVKDVSTDRIYVLRVPPTVKTCHEGISYTFGLKPEEYNPEIET